MPTAVIGPESPVSTTTSMARAVTPATSGFRKRGSHGMWSSNHCACAGQRLDVARLGFVNVADDSLPGAFDAARVHVDLDEAVDGVDGRILIAHPRDVVRDPIGVLSGFVEPNERLERARPSTEWRTVSRREDDRRCAGSRDRSGRRLGRPPPPAVRRSPSDASSARSVR